MAIHHSTGYTPFYLVHAKTYSEIWRPGANVFSPRKPPQKNYLNFSTYLAISNLPVTTYNNGRNIIDVIVIGALFYLYKLVTNIR